MNADYYKILGVERTATEEEIKKAFRSKSKILHPDAGGDADEFRKLKHAFDILGDPARRGRYDDLGCDREVEPNAMAALEEIFSSILTAADSVIDVVLAAKEVCKREIGQAKKATKKIDEDLRKLERYAKQVRMKAGVSKENLFSRALDGRVSRARHNLGEVKFACEVWARTLELLQDYEFEEVVMMRLTMSGSRPRSRRSDTPEDIFSFSFDERL